MFKIYEPILLVFLALFLGILWDLLKGRRKQEQAEAVRKQQAEQLEAEGKRQAEQLEAERKRQAEQLEAERKRQAEQLEAEKKRQAEQLEAEKKQQAYDALTELDNLLPEMVGYHRDATVILYENQKIRLRNLWINSISLYPAIRPYFPAVVKECEEIGKMARLKFGNPEVWKRLDALEKEIELLRASENQQSQKG